MPIYAYRCAACGHAKDVLQKLSDPLLVVCPACGAAAFEKQVTAAGFQLKGSGWYVTDFRDGNKAGAKKDKADDKPAGETADAGAAKADDAAKPAAPAADAAAPKPSAAPAPESKPPAPPPAPAGS
jgi:putative FmdB family regulatory protein